MSQQTCSRSAPCHSNVATTCDTHCDGQGWCDDIIQAIDQFRVLGQQRFDSLDVLRANGIVQLVLEVHVMTPVSANHSSR